MIKLSILKVESPSCLWCRVVQGPGGDAETTGHYNKLLAQMNLFYSDVTQDLQNLKPQSVEDGQVCVVFWSVKKSWCRAVVESVITDSITSQARCFLVDHGERVLIPFCQIRVAMPDFLQLPFWVKKFHLAGIKPTTLRVSIFEEKAELIPSSQWDSSATLYLHNLLQASTQVEAVVVQSESDSTSIELYLSIRDIKICVNDELVAKRFAYYNSEATDGGLDKSDRTPVMLSSDVLTRPIFTFSKKSAAQAEEPSVTSQSSYATNAADSLTAPPLPQSHLFEPVSCDGERRSETPEEQRSSDRQSRNGSEAAVTESDSSEDTESLLAAVPNKNLNLSRFLKFLNPSTIHQQMPPDVDQSHEVNSCPAEQVSGITKQQELLPARTSSETELTPVIPDQQTSLQRSLTSGAEEGLLNTIFENEVNERTRFMLSTTSSEESVEPEAAQTWRRSKEDCLCRLLEWLNPEPLNPDPDEMDGMVSPPSPRMNGIVVHSALPVEPCNSLEDAPLTDSLRWRLQRKQNHTLSPAEHHSWPALARGCNTVVISPESDQPLSYLSPLLSHIFLNSIFSFNCSTGPIAVVLSPGWERLQVVYDVLTESKSSQVLHPLIVLLGTGKDEAKTVKIPKNCLLLLTTPFSLVRLLSCHSFVFLRLYHLVLDEADKLFNLAPDQMTTILQHFEKVTSSQDKASCPQQLVVAAKRWTCHMENLIESHMPYPCIVITIPEEAALYGNVHQVTTMTLESSKISALLGVLYFGPDVCQKTVIIANSAQEVDDVFKAVSSKSAFCLKTHEELTHQFDFVIQQWRKTSGRGTNVILVTTDECLSCLGIRDATSVVHYGFPASPKLFGRRLFCMAENFRNLSKRVSSQDKMESCSRVSRSVLLISEKNTRHVVGVLRYVERTNALLPPELLSFAHGLKAAREDQKTDRPLCSYLKSFGFCRDSGTCPDRHRFNFQLDQSLLPASGFIDVIPLYVKTASIYYGRLIRKEDPSFDLMVTEMASYYTDRRPGAKELLEGGLYAVQEDEVFQRVKIISLPDHNEGPFFSVFVHFIDVGKKVTVKSLQILQLPDQFHSLPGQATEIIVCRVKPIDAETDWHPKVTRTISQKIRGLQHRARAVLSLGNTVFVDPMVRVTQVPGTKTLINEYNVQSEILNTGMGVSNQEHLDLLRDLCQHGLVSEDADHLSKLEDELQLVEVRAKEEEVVLTEAFRVASALNAPHEHPCEPFNSTVSTKQPQIQAPAPEVHMDSVCDQKLQFDGQADSSQPNTRSTEQIKSIRDGELCSTGGPAACLSLWENGVLEGDDQINKGLIISSNMTDSSSTSSFHPQVQWYQTSDSVTLTVKLINPEGQRCDFYPDRVLYSGRVNGRSYRADLELHQRIAADSCSWEMKSNEPVLKLVKQQQGTWDRLVRNKNIFVRYNMEHFDEEEDMLPNGLLFEGNTGEDFWYNDSESSSDSD